MSELLECPCCKEKPLPCPFCGKAAKIYGESVVECSDFNCGGQIDFGHWCGVENGIPAVHFVIKQWNKRHSKKEIERQQAEIERLRTAINRALADSESGKGWGPDVTVCAYLREALNRD